MKYLSVCLQEKTEVHFPFNENLWNGTEKMMNPKYMRIGIERSIQTEQLIRTFLHTPAPNPYWSVSKSELRQLEEMDIPHFLGRLRQSRPER